MASIAHLSTGLFFDWYQGTIPARIVVTDGELIEDIIPVQVKTFVHAAVLHFKDLPDYKGKLDVTADITPRVPQYGYAIEVRSGGKSLLHVCYGGNGGGVHFIATGSGANDVYEWLSGSSEYSGRYSVTRADVRMDMVDPAAWEYMRKIGIRCAKENRISTRTMGDWIEGKGGRTLYLGSKTSVVQVRIYEKGKKEGSNPDWVRFEAQVRPPKKIDKQGASDRDALGFLSWSTWLWGLYCTIVNERKAAEKRPVLGVVWSADKRSDDFKARNLLKQYGKTLEALADRLGGWDKVGVYLERTKQMVESEGVPTAGHGDNPYDKQRVFKG